MSPIILYGLPRSPPCASVLLLAETIGLPIELKETDILATKVNLTESFLRMNPAHSIPTLDDNGFHIWESRAILGYLVQRYAKDDQLYPKDIKKRAMVDNFLFFESSSLYPSFTTCLIPVLWEKKPIDPKAETNMKNKLAILDTILSRNAYAAGDKLTIADISLVASLNLLEGFNYSLNEYNNIVKWQAKVQSEIPSYKTTGKKAADELKDLVQRLQSGGS